MKKPVVLSAAFLLAFGAFLAGRITGRSRGTDHTVSRHVLYYVDPMHPAYRSDKPGIAPDCGMALEPVYDNEDVNTNSGLPAGALSLTAEKRQMIGLRVERVEKNSGMRLIRTTGKVEADDNRVYRLTAGAEGWVQSLENNPAGAVVKKNQLLATFYSRELRTAQQAYLGSLVTMERLHGGREMDDSARGNDTSLRINEEQLRSLGMGEPQIKILARTREITHDITLSSPVDGVVLSRDLSSGQRFDRGTEFYRIADLSKVWIVADIFADEAQCYRPGARAKVTVRELGKTLYARVGNTPPLFESASRTLSLRLEADNPGFVLRPGMFVDLEFSAPAPRGLSVPQEAVLDSGLQKIVYVETADGVFEPRSVQTGPAYSGRIAITRGLSEGDRVVTSGNFLLDSESRMRSAVLVASPRSDDKDAAVALAHDPVCGMALTSANAQSGARVGKYRGETYFFCSDKCRNKFRQDPARYAGEKLGSVAGPLRESRRGDD